MQSALGLPFREIAMYCKHCYTESPNTSPRCIQCGEAFFDNSEVPALSPQSPTKKFALGIEGIVPLIVGWYSGIVALFLGLATAPFWWISRKLLKPAAQIYAEAIAAQAGQMVVLVVAFMAVGSRIPVVSRDLVGGVVLDVLIPAVGICWLAFRPGIRPVVFLSGYQGFALAANVINLLSMGVGTMEHKALVGHVLWRSIALFLMWKGFMNGKQVGETQNQGRSTVTS